MRPAIRTDDVAMFDHSVRRRHDQSAFTEIAQPGSIECPFHFFFGTVKRPIMFVGREV